MAQKPTSSSITLIFKSSTTSLFVFTTPTSTVLSIKQQIISMLEANATHLPNSVPVPSSPKDIIFGKPVDSSDVKKGFVRISNIPGGAKGNNMKIDSAGFKDNGVYAFSIKRLDEDRDDGVDDEEEEEDDNDKQQKTEFDVEFPIDDYGETQGASQSR